MLVACYETDMHFFMSDVYCVCYTDIDVQKEANSYRNILYKNKHIVIDYRSNSGMPETFFLTSSSVRDRLVLPI
jgi:hypothetical protein